MNVFLRLKHWQVFSAIVIIPFFIQIVMMIAFTASNNPFLLLVLFPVTGIISLGSFFGWFYSLGTGLYRKLPHEVKMNLSFFKIAVFLPMTYIFLFLGFVVKSAFSEKGDPVPHYFVFIIPIHLFMMFCIFYLLYFISKSLKAVELQRSVTFNDYAGEFFLIWFYPIGIWFIQPRVNELFKKMK